ncbi:MAG: glycosyltransferase family 4 protein [Alphaproteobacteria bacterium]
MAPTRIAIIDPLGRHGGFHYYVDGLARGLCRAGFEVRVYVTQFTGAGGQQPYKASVCFGDLYGNAPIFARAVRFLRGTLVALRGARAHGAQIVSYHIFNYGLREIAAVWLARLFGMKVVLTLHEVEGGARLYRALVQGAAAGFILHNRFALAAFERRGGALSNPRTIIKHGSYCEHFPTPPPRKTARAALGLPGSPALPVIFLFFGNPRPDKGLDLLLEACAGLKQHRGWMLVVAGKMNPGQRARCQSLVDRHGLGDQVRVDAGHVGDAQLAAYFRAANLVVAPYIRVCESGVALMAMSLGRAVLVADLEPLAAAVDGGKAGILFKSRDPKALGRALADALRDPAALDTLGERAKTHVARSRD